ncbi:mannose-6-phosphate isomerase, class I [Actinorugispora endophytica]|uniref:mannose-6-phosphate isomerase n=1 Tax=Actinorugispora endophytica TaxID=1605990 RepID=A0A4R6UWA1_9ACTN|nr:mannose-6-phosphate isomerase, class I [Actinorugispora endophytica]TDQ51630.1 mannose-6-phosphate isomerase type 1 [Actinorugispora endophytica]
MRRLVNRVRPYEWGSRTAIPRLLGEPSDGRPQAELWLGAHPGAPSEVVTEDGRRTLGDLIAADPKEALGESAVTRFGERLPFLLKVLAVEAPLSLQAHPGEARARAGFALEEAGGIPVDAPERNYRDPHHKPELVLALEPFEALCGFRPPDSARAELAGFTSPLARALRADLAGPDENTALRTAMTRLLTLPHQDRPRAVGALVDEFARRAAAGDGPGPHAATVVELADRYPGDPGAIAALLLNRITLRPGEALFLPAGNVHAYLRGLAVEVMAGSDNVLRAGLTAKHVDPAELLAAVEFAVLPIPYSRPRADLGRSVYEPGVADFALSVVEPGAAPTRIPGDAPRIVLVLDGAARLETDRGQGIVLERGESVFVAAADGAVTVGGGARVVVASTGTGPAAARP